MQVSAKLNKFRVSARKVRLVADMVKKKKVSEAKIQLQFSTKKTAADMLNLLNSAVANAKNNFGLNEENLYIENILVNDGPVLKRWRPRAMGRASAIRKRTCFVELILMELGDKANDKAGKKVDEKKESLKKSPDIKNKKAVSRKKPIKEDK